MMIKISYNFLRSIYHSLRNKFKKKYNILNQYPERNIFGKNVKLYNTKWGKGGGANTNCEIANTIIGNYCQIGENVIIGPRNHIFTNFTVSDFIYKPEEFPQGRDSGMYEGYYNKIGDNVWIGRNTIVLQGVEICSNAIIAAGSVVVKSVPPYSIVGGNPARLIRYKFNSEIIKKLDALNWTEWSQSEIIKRRDELEAIVEFNLNEFIAKQWKTSKAFLI